MKIKKDLFTSLHDNFAYDVSALPAYTDEQNEEILTDLVYTSGLTSRVTVQEGNKGTETMKLLNVTMALQSATSCAWNADGSVTFTGEDLVTKRVKNQMELCNEDLNGTWAQMLNVIGANRQDETLPLESVIEAYSVKTAMKTNQDLMIKGDTTSLNPDLVHYDGYQKLWDADADLGLYTSLETSITVANALSIALGLYNTIDSVLFDNGEPVEIICGRETYRKIIENVYNDNNFHHQLEEEQGTEPSFILPTTNIRVRSYPQFNGTEKMYAVPYRFMFYGTDLTSDVDGFVVKYNDNDEKLRFGTKWRSGVSYVFPEYFVRLALS